MRNGRLQDGDVAMISRLAVDLLAEDADIRIDPLPAADPYRWGSGAWIVRPLLDRGHPLSVRVEGTWTPVQALAFVMRSVAEWVESTGFYWGVPYPVCPGHQHAATIETDDDAVVLRCPESGEAVRRIDPLNG